MQDLEKILSKLKISHELKAISNGKESIEGKGSKITVTTPISGEEIYTLKAATVSQTEDIINQSNFAFKKWREVPAPKRGEVIRTYRDKLRMAKSFLAELITLECGKITTEALGEVQEMIDICDYAVGISRQLYGKVMPSEREKHSLRESWHPVGTVGIISAFNFPMAVWCWNSSIALVCGNVVLWKPSEVAPISAIVAHELLISSFIDCGYNPYGISSLVVGDAKVGKAIAASEKIPIVSATGSVAMGRHVATTVAGRFGKSILELGGNNGMIITESADLDLVTRATLFGAVGTCGQRCTSLRRLIIDSKVSEVTIKRLVAAYKTLAIGDPRVKETLVGPIINEDAFNNMQKALKQAKKQGGEILVGGERVTYGLPPKAFYVEPAIVKINSEAEIVKQETFAPILYVTEYDIFEEAIQIHNNVPQGLSSAVFTTDMKQAEIFCSATGSDCGIANVNIGTSGAEIGGAFGGEKHTGGGRVAGSDSWRAYMRRMTTTVNYSNKLPLAQGVKFV